MDQDVVEPGPIFHLAPRTLIPLDLPAPEEIPVPSSDEEWAMALDGVDVAVPESDDGWEESESIKI